MTKKRAIAEEKEKEKMVKAKMKQHMEEMEKKKREERKFGISRDEGRFMTNTNSSSRSFQEPIVESKNKNRETKETPKMETKKKFMLVWLKK